MRIVEGKVPLRIQPIPEDTVGADPKDPTNCFFVHSVRRMYQSQIVVFWKNVAYLDMIDEDGVRRVYRYMIPKEGTERICRFDHGEPFPLGSAIILLPPNKNQTLRRKKQYEHKRVKRNRMRSTQLRSNLDKKTKAVALVSQRLEKAMSNEKQDAKKIAQIQKQKETAEAALKKVQTNVTRMDNAKSERTPRKFDLTTRNGAVGNYHFTGK